MHAASIIVRIVGVPVFPWCIFNTRYKFQSPFKAQACCKAQAQFKAQDSCTIQNYLYLNNLDEQLLFYEDFTFSAPIGQCHLAHQLLFRKTITRWALIARKRGKLLQHLEFPCRSPIQLLLCPHVTWPKNGLTSLYSTQPLCNCWTMWILTKNLVFLANIWPKRVVISGWNLSLNLFQPDIHLPSVFCSDRSSGASSYRGQTHKQTNNHADIPLYTSR